MDRLRRPSRILLIAGGIIAVLVVAIGILGYKYGQAVRTAKSDDTTLGNRVIQEVGQLYILPTNETPSVVQIQNKSDLKQSFFDTARNGDYLLVYKADKLAIIYRESVHKIVTVGPINLTGSSTP